MNIDESMLSEFRVETHANFIWLHVFNTIFKHRDVVDDVSCVCTLCYIAKKPRYRQIINLHGDTANCNQYLMNEKGIFREQSRKYTNTIEAPHARYTQYATNRNLTTCRNINKFYI